MNAITSERQGGKTSKMIFWMLLHPEAVMVVHSHMERQRLIGRHGELKGRIFTFDDFAHRSPGIVHPDTPVCIDNIDMLLRQRFGNVQLISYSEGDEWWALSVSMLSLTNGGEGDDGNGGA